MLIAGDILFAETGGLIDTAERDVSDARQAMARAQSTREGAWANEQSLLAGGLIAVWIFALTVLVPVPAVRPVEVPSSLSLNERARPQLEEDVAASASPQADQGASPVNEPGPAVPPDAEKRTGDQSAASSSAPVDGVETQRDTTAAVFLETAARLCTDIGRVAEASDLGPLLGRTATLLGATGVVVWLVAPDGQRLVPAMAHGYDDAQLGRMGSIGADDDNLTATAFRTSRATHASANGHVPGAVAVPILSASGTSGVLAAEVPEGTDLSRAEAVAALVAAQLAGMFPAVNPGNIPKSEVANERSEASSEA